MIAWEFVVLALAGVVAIGVCLLDDDGEDAPTDALDDENPDDLLPPDIR